MTQKNDRFTLIIEKGHGLMGLNFATLSVFIGIEFPLITNSKALRYSAQYPLVGNAAEEPHHFRTV